jgi:hypothetical protein
MLNDLKCLRDSAVTRRLLRNPKPLWYDFPWSDDTDSVRKRPRNLLLVKPYLDLVMPTQEQILKLRITNALVFSLERTD